MYEVKSEFDNLERLNSQIKNYFKAFDTVNVVTYEANEQKIIRKIDNDNVGVIILNDRNELSERKPAIADSSNLSNESIFKILRKNEYENIILKYYGALPSTSVVMYYRECLWLINEIDTLDFYHLAIDELRKRNISNRDEYSSYVPYELKYPIYFSRLQKSDYIKLDNFLSTSYGG